MKTLIDTQAPDLERMARRRAGAKLGFFIHAFVFAAVNLMLVMLAASSGKGWVLYPAWGWGLGLAIHGAVVFLITGGGGLHAKLLQHERNRLQLQRDPW
ncbi:2TM domain-containing protein [Caenimonas aquaedulcis]|uniref:2TM domain-containing protein n=1 Tax=Caenimonas aquaedulcis TaxID=2793270 RepID=A0A931H386_9BURK|nr:2TM domain-containing protein [Caenimonas aquaedulcis]MBG9387733.1 2TM domain-containing protein [Caenimonas aquaedulcis]